MAIPGISPELFASIFVPTTQGSETPVGGVSPQDFFVVAMTIYLLQLQQLVTQSWQTFAESTQTTAEQNNQAHRAREIRAGQEEASRLVGQQRQVETLQDSPSDDILFPDAVSRQAGLLRFHQSMFTGDSDRHLNLPV